MISERTRDVRRASRGRPLERRRAAAAAAASKVPRLALERELPDVVVVPNLVPGVVEAAEHQERLAVRVDDHAVATSRARTRLGRERLPRVRLELEPPQIAVVIELLLVRRRELAAVDVHVSPVRDRLVRAPRRRRVRRDDARESILLHVVSVQIAKDARLPSRVHDLAAVHHDLRGLLRERRRERAVTPRARLGRVLRDVHRGRLRVQELDVRQQRVDVVLLPRAIHPALELGRVLVRLPVRLGRAARTAGRVAAGSFRRFLALVAPGTHGGGAPSTRARGARKSE